MELYGGICIPRPSNLTAVGCVVLERYPDHPGTLAAAISEAGKAALQRGINIVHYPSTPISFISFLRARFSIRETYDLEIPNFLAISRWVSFKPSKRP